MNKTTIWRVPKYLPYVQPPLTDAILIEAEKKLGYKLPSEYVELLKVQNGGYIRFHLPKLPHEGISGIGPYFPSLTEFDWTELHDYVSYQLNGLVPFDGDGHWFLCFDYRNGLTNPQITYIDTELDAEEVIAKDFKDYLGKLVHKVDEEYALESNLPIVELVNRIAAILKINFEPPDYWAHGYAIYRSKFKESWVWVTPNQVPAGFVRNDHERYEELKSQIAPMALRFPELSQKIFFVSVSSDDDRKYIIDLLNRNAFTLRPVKELI